MNNAMKEEALGAVERGGTIYAKRSFNPETTSNQIELNDPEFWEKLLQHPNADMLWQRLQDPTVMSDGPSVESWMHDLENLVKELCEEEDRGTVP